MGNKTSLHPGFSKVTENSDICHSTSRIWIVTLVDQWLDISLKVSNPSHCHLLPHSQSCNGHAPLSFEIRWTISIDLRSMPPHERKEQQSCPSLLSRLTISFAFKFSQVGHYLRSQKISLLLNLMFLATFRSQREIFEGTAPSSNSERVLSGKKRFIDRIRRCWNDKNPKLRRSDSLPRHNTSHLEWRISCLSFNQDEIDVIELF